MLTGKDLKLGKSNMDIKEGWRKELEWKERSVAHHHLK
jgi:hypothetical protein